jgi:hypothetical protein
MSLGKLLATGRSLVGGAPDAGRYNISERNRLPKFGSAKNPFANPPAATPVSNAPITNPKPIEPVIAVEVATTSPFAAPAVQPTPSAVQSVTPLPSFASVLPDPVGAPGARFGQRVLSGWSVVAQGTSLLAKRVWPMLKRVVALIGRWISGGFGRLRRPEPKSFIPRFGKPAVQTELSLDNVKVVRSDLVESDLEVVEAGTETGTQAGPKVPARSTNRGPVPPALKKLTDRILGPQLH